MVDPEQEGPEASMILKRKAIMTDEVGYSLPTYPENHDCLECPSRDCECSTKVPSISSQYREISAGPATYGVEGHGTADIEAASRTYTRSIAAEAVNDSNVVNWDGPDDPDNPVNWPIWLRWTHIGLVSAVNFLTGLASSMFAPGVPQLMDEFHSTNDSLSSLVVTIFVLGLALGPIIFAPLSEIYGRLYIQHLGLVGFLVFTLACGASSSLNMLIVFRLCQGTFGSVPLTNAGAIIADMVKLEFRGFAMAMFTFGVLLGPVIGPVSGGFLSAAIGWRWIMWVLAMAISVVALACFIVWRESYAPVLLGRKAARLRRETGNMALRSKYDDGSTPRAYFQRSIGRAIKILIYSPVVLALSIYMGLVYSYFYLLQTTLTPVFESNYDFGTGIVGLSFLGIGLGFLVGQIVYARLGDAILRRMAEGKEMKPEYRLPLCLAGAAFVPVGLFWYGWTVETKVQWVVPIFGTGVMAFGNCLIFTSIQSYIVDAFELYAASALAANTVVRSVMAAVLPLAAPKMYDAMGYGWGNSLLAFLALAMVPIPWFLIKYGEVIRGWHQERIKGL